MKDEENMENGGFLAKMPRFGAGVKIGEDVLALYATEKNIFWVLKPGKDLHFFTVGVWAGARPAPTRQKCRKISDRHAKNERK